MIKIGEKDPQLAQQVLDRCATGGVKFVNMQFTDILGVVKSVTIPVELLSEAIENNIWFDGSSIEGFARIAESDMYLVPDLTTFAILPWEKENPTARIICWVFSPNGQPFVGGTRNCLAKVLNEAEEMGFIYNTGPELEFFLFPPDIEGRIVPMPHDRAGYFDLSTDIASDVRKQMVNALQAMGIQVEASHHEVAIGQHEIDFRYGQALKVGDNAVTFKTTLKAIAQKNNLHATFMPKPIFGINGSGMHVHQSLFDVNTGKNAFVDHNDEYGLSDIAKHFIAGQLAHARGMCAILAPLVNSYKRLVPGYEAPVYISWARVNRSALIRVPQIVPGRDSATRLELRCPDPSCNPYLAQAVMLKAGLDGIKRRLPVPEPIEENLYHFDEAELARRNITMLPATLGDALDEMKKDPIVREALGDHIFERFIEAKTQEWDQYRMYVSPWELDRYLREI